METNNQTIILGSGCFWCTEAIFKNLKGVENVTPGYSGGTLPNPTYKEVCKGDSDHAEVIKVEYNPRIIDTAQLLKIFFASHNPTTLNRQGNDVGTQYRSVIFYTTDEQKRTAEMIIKKLQFEKTFDDPIVTQIESAKEFYPAEDYHQNYYANNKTAPYCMFVISPKMAKFRLKFKDLLKR